MRKRANKVTPRPPKYIEDLPKTPTSVLTDRDFDRLAGMLNFHGLGLKTPDIPASTISRSSVEGAVVGKTNIIQNIEKRVEGNIVALVQLTAVMERLMSDYHGPGPVGGAGETPTPVGLDSTLRRLDEVVERLSNIVASFASS